MGAGMEPQDKVAKADQNNEGSVLPVSDPSTPSAPALIPTAQGQNFTNFTVDPSVTFDVNQKFTLDASPPTSESITPQQNTSLNPQPVSSDPQMPTAPEFREFQLSPEAIALASGNLDGLEFSFTDALPASLFDDLSVWNDGVSTTFSTNKEFSFSKDYTWKIAEDDKYTFEGVRKMGTVIANAIGDKAKIDPKICNDINESFGFLCNAQSQSSTPGGAVKDRPLETNIKELGQNAVDAVLNHEPLFHETSGENRGRAYKSRIENTLKLLQEGKLDLNDPEVKKMVVAIARQLYAEGALEPNQILPFYEMLKMGEFGRDITPEQFEKLVNDLSPDQMKRLLDGSIATLKERLVSPPKAWIMNRTGALSDEDMDTLRGRKGASPKEVLDVVNNVWSRDEILQAETNFYRQTGYHTSFYEDTNGYTNYAAGLRAIEARADSSTGNNAYLSTLSSSSPDSVESPGYNGFFRSYLTGSIPDVLIASGELMEEQKKEDEREKKENEGGQVSWFTDPLLTTLALAGKVDTVIDTKFRNYIPVDELSQDSTTSPAILSTAIKLPSPDDTDDQIG